MVPGIQWCHSKSYICIWHSSLCKLTCKAFFEHWYSCLILFHTSYKVVRGQSEINCFLLQWKSMLEHDLESFNFQVPQASMFLKLGSSVLLLTTFHNLEKIKSISSSRRLRWDEECYKFTEHLKTRQSFWILEDPN
jgi:hypothetical protein